MDFSHVRIGEPCKVFVGAGWEKGTVLNKQKDSVTVQLPQRMVRVFDSRNVKR